MDTAFEGAQVVIPKNWGGFASFNIYKDNDEQRRIMAANLAKYKNWRCTAKTMNLTADDARLMHSMPVDRGREVDDDVVDSDASLIYDEAENRLHTAKALMTLTMGRRGS